MSTKRSSASSTLGAESRQPEKAWSASSAMIPSSITTPSGVSITGTLFVYFSMSSRSRSTSTRVIWSSPNTDRAAAMPFSHSGHACLVKMTTFKLSSPGAPRYVNRRCCTAWDHHDRLRVQARHGRPHSMSWSGMRFPPSGRPSKTVSPTPNEKSSSALPPRTAIAICPYESMWMIASPSSTSP